MQKLKNTKFLLDLINSDFLIVNSSKRKEKNKLLLQVNFNSFQNLNVLNLLHTNKSLKQFIYFLKKLHDFDNSSIYIWVEDTFVIDFLKQIFFKSNPSVKIDIGTTPPSLKQNQNDLRFILILGTPSNYSNKTLLQNLFKNKNFLITKINYQVEKNYFGYYKIFNDLSDLKKIIFICSIIDQILNYQKKNEKIK